MSCGALRCAAVAIHPHGNRCSVRLWLGFGDEHDVVEPSSARAGQLFAVVRPVEPEDLIGREVGHLFGRAAVKRLIPDVRSAVAGRDEADAATAGRPAYRDRGVSVGRNVDDLFGAAAGNWNDRDLPVGPRFGAIPAGDLLPT